MFLFKIGEKKREVDKLQKQINNLQNEVKNLKQNKLDLQNSNLKLEKLKNEKENINKEEEKKLNEIKQEIQKQKITKSDLEKSLAKPKEDILNEIRNEQEIIMSEMIESFNKKQKSDEVKYETNRNDILKDLKQMRKELEKNKNENINNMKFIKSNIGNYDNYLKLNLRGEIRFIPDKDILKMKEKSKKQISNLSKNLSLQDDSLEDINELQENYNLLSVILECKKNESHNIKNKITILDVDPLSFDYIMKVIKKYPNTSSIDMTNYVNNGGCPKELIRTMKYLCIDEKIYNHIMDTELISINIIVILKSCVLVKSRIVNGTKLDYICKKCYIYPEKYSNLFYRFNHCLVFTTINFDDYNLFIPPYENNKGYIKFKDFSNVGVNSKQFDFQFEKGSFIRFTWVFTLKDYANYI